MNFERRKRVLEYDDVINKQRETIYAQRQKVLSGEDVADNIQGMITGVIEDAVHKYTPGHAEEWNLDALRQDFCRRVSGRRRPEIYGRGESA